MRKIYLLVIYISLILPILAHGDDVGFQVKQETLPVNEVANEALNIKTDKVQEVIVDDTIKTTGEVEEIPENHFDVNSPVQGKVISIAVSLGDQVRVGQTLATIQSTDVAGLLADVDQLEAELELAKSNFNRSKLLLEKGIIPEKDFQAAKAMLASQEAKLRASTSNLKILTQGSYGKDGTFSLKAQKGGTIVEKKVTLGQIINPNDLLFHGIDLSTVWASADIYERDIAKVKQGQKISATLDGIPDKVFTAQLSFIDSVLNKDSRTLAVKAVVNNSDGLLKPGQFLQLIIHNGTKRNSIIIPRTALVEMDKSDVEGKHKHLVYLKIDDKYVPREIEVQVHDSNTVEVISGLEPGEELVTQGAYQLQYGEGEDEHDHDHDKAGTGLNFKAYSTPLTVLAVVVALIAGYLIGRRKKHDK